MYCFACLMGGAGFIFTKENDADIMHDSALINLNIAKVLSENQFKGTLFYSSSACIYPSHIQEEENNPGLRRPMRFRQILIAAMVMRRFFSEIMFTAFARNKGLNVRIARFHNIYGPEGTFRGGKEKAPAAMCQKGYCRGAEW